MTLPIPHHNSETDRLTRIETVVERLEHVVQKIAEREGRPNWNMLGVLIPALLVVIGGCAAVVFGPIQNNASEIHRINDVLSNSIQREIDRNNRLEREMGEVTMFINLYTSGKLKLD